MKMLDSSHKYEKLYLVKNVTLLIKFVPVPIYREQKLRHHASS